MFPGSRESVVFITLKKYFTFWGCYIWALCLHNFSPSPPTPPGLCPPTRCFPSSWLHILNSVLKNRFQNLVWPALWVLQSDSIGIFSATNLCNGGVTVSPRTERVLNLRSAVRLSLDQCPSLFPLSFRNGFRFFSSSPWSRAGGGIWFMSYWSVTFFYKLSGFFLLPFGFPKLLLMVFFGMESVFPLLFWPFSITPPCFPYVVDWAWRRSDPYWRSGLLIRGIRHCNAQSRDKSAFPVWNNSPSVWREHSK